MSTAPERLLRRIEWRVLRRLDGQLQGAHKTAFRGSGFDFADLRGYLPHDDVRHIDWNATARSNEPFVREYLEDRELMAWLVLDCSASMRFGPEGREKSSSLADVAVSIARMLTMSNDRVGALLYDGGVKQVIPPKGGRDQVLRIADSLLRIGQAEPVRTSTDLASMLGTAAATIRRRSLVFVISDFIGEPGWERNLTRLTSRNDVVIIRIVDPSESELPQLGMIIVEDAETGEQVLVDSSDPAFRARFAAAASEREATLRATIRRAGVSEHIVSTRQDPAEALLGIARSHARRIA